MHQDRPASVDHLGMRRNNRDLDGTVSVCMDNVTPEYGTDPESDFQGRKEKGKMIMTGQDTPYHKAMAEKERASITSDVVLTDAQINKSIENYIVSSTSAQTLLSAIRIIIKCYPVSPEHKVRLIEDILKGDES